MKEMFFRFTESYGKCIKEMSDKQAGKFIKNICNYAFEETSLDSNDSTIRASFTFVKKGLDAEKRRREKVRKGLSKNNEKKENNEIIIITGVVKPNCKAATKEKDTSFDSRKSVAKSTKNKAG